jgi:uncharacterized protein (DUF1684 family)
MSRLRLALGPVAVAALLAAGAETYHDEIRRWQADRERRLKADDGWLTVAGLFWLKEGKNRFGAEASNDIVLPAGSAPARAGVFEFRGGETRVRMEDGVSATVDGKPAREALLRPDTARAPDIVAIGDLQMTLIKRGDRYGIRLRDRNSSLRREFSGLRFFPVKDSYRVVARFTAAPSKIPVSNIIGQTEPLNSPGYVQFKLEGQDLKLTPVFETDGAKELFFMFRDLTSGKQTYGAGRFLYSGLPKNGRVVLDFNKAYNPPCAFTPYATCPLPPKSNRLPVRIEAGELAYGGGHH